VIANKHSAMSAAFGQVQAGQLALDAQMQQLAAAVAQLASRRASRRTGSSASGRAGVEQVPAPAGASWQSGRVSPFAAAAEQQQRASRSSGGA